MDVRNYTWVDRFEPTPLSSTTETHNDNQTIKIVIGTISGIIGTAIFGILGYKCYYQKRKQKEVIRISGNFSSEMT